MTRGEFRSGANREGRNEDRDDFLRVHSAAETLPRRGTTDNAAQGPYVGIVPEVSRPG